MVLRLFIFTFCLTAKYVFGCTYYQNRGLFMSSYDTFDPGLLVLTNRTIDTNVAYAGTGGIADIRFNSPIEMMRADSLNYWIRVCDHGVLHLADTQANLQNCIAQAAVSGIDETNPQPIIIADVMNEASWAIGFTAEVYHVSRTDQLNSDGNIIGPSFCDIEIIEGLINDCEEEHRYNQSVQEFAVVTWNTQHAVGMGAQDQYIYQAVVAVTTENRTYVMFLFNDTQSIMSDNGVAKGIIHAANAGLTGSVQRFSQICNATTDTTLHEKSNCRCAQKGHFVLETTEGTLRNRNNGLNFCSEYYSKSISETTPGMHGFCGTEAGKDTCATQPSFDYGTNVNRNCRTPDHPQGTCDAAAYCLSGATDELVLLFKNYNTDRVSFVNYTQFTQSDGSTGFDAPYGENVHVIDAGAGNCTSTVAPSNGTFENIMVQSPSSANCFEVDTASNTINFVLLFWNSVDGVNVTTLYTRFLVGSCDLDDLPSFRNLTLKAGIYPVKNESHKRTILWVDRSLQGGVHCVYKLSGDVSSTTVFPGVSAQLSLVFYDRRSQNNPQPFFFLTTSIQLGRMIFPQVCYTPKLPFVADVTAYGIYVFSCQLSNNPEFINNGVNVTIEVIQADGCLPSIPAQGQFGRFVDHFKRDATTLGEVPFCAFSGGFRAFKWDTVSGTGPNFIYMRCVTDVCTNTQLYLESKCKDSCANTLVNSNVTDDDDARRRKRQFDDIDGQIVSGVIEVIDPDQTEQEQLTIDTSHCVDPSVAKGVIGALVALLIISTVLTLVLFFMLKSTKIE